MALEQDSLSPGRKCQENVSHGDKIVTTLNELDLLFSLMFDELLNGPSQVVSKSSVVPTADESIQQLNAENDQVADDEFINIFSTPVQDQRETSSCHVDSSNMHTFYQRYPSEHRWTKDHPLEQVIGNPSQSVRTRRQLESDAEIVFNKRTRVIVETIHVIFDELPQMASDRVSSDPASECQRMALEHDNLSPGTLCQDNVTQADRTITTSNELDLLFSPMFDELLNGSSKVVSKSFDVSTADAPN
nr:hypothetical protein [Tanacetum cinerariifolium]